MLPLLLLFLAGCKDKLSDKPRSYIINDPSYTTIHTCIKELPMRYKNERILGSKLVKQNNRLYTINDYCFTIYDDNYHLLFNHYIRNGSFTVYDDVIYLHDNDHILYKIKDNKVEEYDIQGIRGPILVEDHKYIYFYNKGVYKHNILDNKEVWTRSIYENNTNKDKVQLRIDGDKLYYSNLNYIIYDKNTGDILEHEPHTQTGYSDSEVGFINNKLYNQMNGLFDDHLLCSKFLPLKYDNRIYGINDKGIFIYQDKVVKQIIIPHLIVKPVIMDHCLFTASKNRLYILDLNTNNLYMHKMKTRYIAFNKHDILISNGTHFRIYESPISRCTQ